MNALLIFLAVVVISAIIGGLAQVLKNVPLFSSFSDQQLQTLLGFVQHRSFPRSTFIVHAGEETDALYIILGVVVLATIALVAVTG